MPDNLEHNYIGGGPHYGSATPQWPVQIRNLEPSGVEVALYLEKFPRIGAALAARKDGEGHAPLVRRVAEVILEMTEKSN